MNLAKQKSALRREMFARSNALSPAIRTERSAAACGLLRQQAVWQGARAILFYAPLGNEIDVWPLLAQALRENKTVALPRFLPEENSYRAFQVTEPLADCFPGTFGIREPGKNCPAIPLNRLDLTLVPGVAFDFMGHRLGRGRGFFDRLLVQLSGIKCGVAFDEQIVERVPVEPHDVSLNCILTPARWQAI